MIMNLYKYRISTGWEGHCIAESYSKCEELVKKSSSYNITKLELIQTDIIIQKPLEND